jgi:hypothetical protein
MRELRCRFQRGQLKIIPKLFLESLREQGIQVFCMQRAGHRILTAEFLLEHQLSQGLFHRERSLLPGDRDLLMQMLQRVLSDVLSRPIPDDR